MRITIDNVILDEKQTTDLKVACETLCLDMDKSITVEDRQKDPAGVKLLTEPEVLLDFIVRQFTHNEYTTFMTAFHWHSSKLADAVTNRLEKMISEKLWESTEDGKRHLDAIVDSLCKFIEVGGNLINSARKIPSKIARDKVRRAVNFVNERTKA